MGKVFVSAQEVGKRAGVSRSALIRALTQRLQLCGKIAMLINTDRSEGSTDLALRQAIRCRGKLLSRARTGIQQSN